MIRRWAAILCFLAMPALLFAWPAKVVGVHDGDSITVLREGNVQVKIRLEGIDAPELKQPFGNAAKKALSDLVFGKTVEVKETGKDRYARTLATITVGSLDANLEMVKTGFAWHYAKYSKDQMLKEAQIQAQLSKRGLWVEKENVPPWEWRKKPKASK
jgi:endonuclease YncB( thermonuclease family)